MDFTNPAVMGAIIGGVVGGLGALIVTLMKNKKK
jgi:LPS O-antigen subunit length determinant protein (WzzB/FepE family)